MAVSAGRTKRDPSPRGVPPNSNAKDASLKRGRETSLEPSAPESQPSVSTTTKKNRLAVDPDSRPITPIAESVLDSPQTEGRHVGEVRRKVERMSYGEGEAEEMDPEQASDLAAGGTREGMGGDEAWEKIDKAEATGSIDNAPPATSVIGGEGEKMDEGAKDLKRKALERSESSFIAPEGAKRPKDTPSPPPASSSTAADVQAAPAPASAPAKKPQASFASFASASPFATRSASALDSAASPLASGSSAPKPATSAFGSSGGFTGFSGSTSPFASKKTSAFGAASISSSALAPKAKKSENGDEGAEMGKDEDDPEAGPSKPSASFGDILAGSGADETSADEKVQMTEQDVITGEEDESTMYQTRTKLYVMQADGGWRERGVGTLRLNVRRKDGQAPRLVMRAEGVLRLILNVSLYVGMTCLEDGKHVRMTVFEEGERKFVTFRTGSPKAAQELAHNIHEFIPLETKSGSVEPTKSPDGVEGVKSAGGSENGEEAV